MTFWIVAIIMAAASVAALAWPLIRGKGAEELDTAEYDIEVYRDQIAEVERDHARGVLSEAEMEAARTEIARRMLAADARLRDASNKASTGGSNITMFRVVAGFLALALPLGAVLLYLQIGQPGAPDMPLASRTDMPDDSEAEELRQIVAELEQAAEADPSNPAAWLRLGAAYKQAERFDDAVAALRRAVGLAPPNPTLNSELGEALFLAAEGSLTPEARAAFEAVLAVEPDDPRANHYLAYGDYQAGRTQEALDRWAALIAASPADAPWLDLIRRHVAQAAEDLGLDVASVMPEPLPAARTGAPMLTPEQRAEIEAMTPEERDEMIRGMVEGLEARLQEDPNDLEGWERLIRARSVMGDQEAAQAALDRALEHFAAAPFPKQRLAGLASELGLDGPAAAEAPDIGAMVERLAARLQDDPDDLEGWMMLARSYTVMGEPEKAREAMANAARLAPDNTDVLILQARAIRDANGGNDNEESIAILRRVLEIAPGNPEALWFLGMAEAQAGNVAEAKALWGRLHDQLPEGSEDRAFIRERIDELPEG